MTDPGPEKKKRKQNVACDPCKLRRVKCDLLTLLAAAGSSSPSPGAEEAPAHVLVRRHPGLPCTNCRNKGLQCSTEGILNPIRPNKGGKRIEEARKRFGGGAGTDLPPDVSLSGTNGFSGHEQTAVSMDDFMTTLLAPPQSTPFAGYAAQHDQQPPVDMLNFAGGPALFSGDGQPYQDISRAGPGSAQQPGVNMAISDAATFLPPHTSALAHEYRDAPPGLSSTAPPARASVGPAPEVVQLEAQEIWRQLSVNTPQTIATRSSRPTPQPVDLVDELDGHTPSPNTLLPALGRLDIETNQFMPIIPDHARPCADNGVKSETTTTRGEKWANEMIRYPDSNASTSPGPSRVGGKRQRVADSGASTPSSGRLDLWDRDPWHIWQSGAEREQSMIAWGRKEQVQEDLADRALGIELSRHLITVYFQAVHFSLPVLSPESFYMEWEACGRRSDRMNPAQEALCAVIEAWAARYSDNPAVLGLPYQKAHTAPKVIMADGQFAPGAQARAHWGRARLPVCNALLDRAGRIIDNNGIMRRPSLTGLQTLSLYNQLMHMSDQGSRVKDQWLQNMLVHSTIIEQMKLLQLFWTSGDPILPTLDALQVRMKQRRLFWTTAIGDSCWAAATGQPPKLPQEELDAGRAWVDEVMDSLPNSTMKVLAFFMKMWHRLAMVGRNVSLKVTKHNGKMGSMGVSELSTAVQQLWSEVRSIMTELNESTLELLGACEPGVLGFSPLNYITNMRLCCPFFLLVLHESIRNHQAFRQKLYQSYVIEPESEEQARSQRGTDMAMLEKLHLQSVDVLLYNFRSQCAMFEEILPTGIIQSASIMIRGLIASAQFLAEVPVNEQGYPGTTLGGYGWTWDEKKKQVDICIRALYQIGWAWSDVSDVVEAVHLAMERMTPTPEEMAAYNGTTNQAPINPKIRDQRLRDMQIEEEGTKLALKFWPPKSIPDIISKSLAGGYADVPLLKDATIGHLSSATPSSTSTATSTSTGPGTGTSTTGSGGSSGVADEATDFDIPFFQRLQKQHDHGMGAAATGAGWGQSEQTSDPTPIPGFNFIATDPSLQGESTGLDPTFWDLLNGNGNGGQDQAQEQVMGQGDDLDIEAFLQSLGG